MKEHLGEEAELRRYLLGELTLEEQVLVEERLFLDDEYMQLAQAMEHELVDEYVHRDLTLGERERFESHFLARPEHRDDLRIAQALKRLLVSDPDAVEPTPAPVVVASGPDHSGVARPIIKGRRPFIPALFGRRPVLGFSLAALIILSVVAWFAVESWRRRERHPPLQAQDSAPRQVEPAEREREPRDTPAANGASQNQGAAEGNTRRGDEHAGRRDERPRHVPPPAQPIGTRVAAFTIYPGGVARGEGRVGIVSVAPDVGTVILKLPLRQTDDYDSYHVTLRRGRRRLGTWTGLKSEIDKEDGKIVAARIPARLLSRQRHQIKLAGLNADQQAKELHTYTFRVD